MTAITGTYDGTLTVKEVLGSVGISDTVVNLIYDQKRVDLGQGESSILVYKVDSTERFNTLGGKTKEITERVSVDIRMVVGGSKTRTDFYNLFDAVRYALERISTGVQDAYNSNFYWEYVEIASVRDLSDKSINLYRKVIDVILHSWGNRAVVGLESYSETGNLYKRQITLSQSSSETLQDYQILIVFDTASHIEAGKMRKDCGDIRFYGSDFAPLYYWIEGPVNSNATKIWVKVKSIPTSGGYIIMTYGNLYLTVDYNYHGADKVFDYYNPCDSASRLAEFSVPYDMQLTYDASAGAYKLKKVDSPDISHLYVKSKTLQSTPCVGHAIYVEFKIKTYGSDDQNIGFGCGKRYPNINRNCAVGLCDLNSGLYSSFARFTDGNGGYDAGGFFTDIGTTNWWWIESQVCNEGGGLDGVMSFGSNFTDFTWNQSLTGNVELTSNPAFAFTGSVNSELWFKNIRVRKYVYNDVSVAIGNEEVM